MNLKRISVVTAIILMFSVLLVGCSSSPYEVMEKAIKKNGEVAYAKLDANVNVGVAGVGVDAKISGELDSKNQKAIMKLSVNSPALELTNMSYDMYVDKNAMYIKDPEIGKFLKTPIEEGDKNTEASKKLNDEMLSVLKDDKTFKDSIKLEKGDASDKVVTASISTETVTKLLEKAVASESAVSAMESSFESAFITAAEGSGVKKSKEEIVAEAKKEAKAAVEEYKNAMKQIKFENIKYTGKVNKDGYLYAQNIAFDLKEPTTGFTINLKLDLKMTDINSGKTVTIPNIPKDQIVESN